MPRKLKRTYKYKCLELMCNTIHRCDKWAEHCKKKHVYKLRNNLEIKYKVIETKDGDGPWVPYSSSSTETEPRSNSAGSSSESFNIEQAGPSFKSLDKSTTVAQDNIAESMGESIDCESMDSLTTSNNLKDREGIHVDNSQLGEGEEMELEVYSISKSFQERVAESNPQVDIDLDLCFSLSENIGQNDDQPFRSIVFNHTDPAFYTNKKLSTEDINLALNLENQDFTSMNFPTTNGRKFNCSWKKVVLPNKSVIIRKWLVYSQERDSAFCLPCLLFALPTERSIWGTSGYRGWANHVGDRDIVLHEKSKNHISSEIARIQWISQKRIDSSLAEQTNKIVEHNREVLSVVIDCCRFLSEEMLGFRNKKCVKGKLLGLFRVLSKYSPDARVYLEKIDKARTDKVKLSSNFLSYRNIYDLVNIMSEIVVSKITHNINSTKVYSIILDSTQDVSKKECSALLIRHVEDEQLDSQGSSETSAKPVERLVKVFTSGDTTGKNLAKEVINCLRSLGLDPNNIVGQSMDGAGNMRGRYVGLKTIIQQDNPKAFYIWCCSHRFALVVEKSLDMCPQIRHLFQFLEECYIFMSGHRRNHVFIKNLEKGNKTQRKQRLKRVQTTRWSSRNDALQTVITCFDVLKQTLSDLCLDSESDGDTKASASGLLKKLLDFDTVSTMLVVKAIFKVLSPITKCLQSQAIDYSVAPKIIAVSKNELAKLRCEICWETVKSEISDFCEQHNVVQHINRNRKRKRFMDEIAVDEAISEPFKKLKVEVYYKVLDSLQHQISDRFPERTLAMVTQMSVFSHEGILSETGPTNVSKNEIEELCQFYNLDTEQIIDELETFATIYKATYSSIDIKDVASFPGENIDDPGSSLQDVRTSGTDDTDDEETHYHGVVQQWLRKGFIRPYRCLLNLSGLPNLRLLYRTLLSLPVTSCSAERAMSRLKIVKNRLRSSLGDAWLSSLMVLCSESDILKEITNEEIINKFAISTEHRKKLLFKK